MINNEEKIEKTKDKDFKEIYGIEKQTFYDMLEILEKDYKERHVKGGRKPKLSVLDKLIIFLQYYREYRAMKHIAHDYGVVKSTICDSIQWVENTLIKCGKFALPKKKSCK